LRSKQQSSRTDSCNLNWLAIVLRVQSEFGNAAHRRPFCVAPRFRKRAATIRHGALMLQRATTAADLREANSMPAAGGLRRSWTTNLRGTALAPIAIVVC
jgi:hypothetical protein